MFAAVLGALPLVVLQPAGLLAGTIRLEPRARITESYTDNVRSVVAGSEADFITQTTVGAKLTAAGNRLNLDLDLNAVHDAYLDTNGLDGFRPKVLGVGDVEFIPDRFFVDGFVSLSEVTASRQGAISATKRNLSSNTKELMSYSLTPRFENRFGRTADAKLEYTYSETLVSQPSAGAGVAPGALGSTGDSKTEEINFELGTGPRFNQLDSRLEINNQKNSTERRRDLTKERAELINEYQIYRWVALIARGGYEDIGNRNPNLDTSGAIGRLGFRLKPGPKLDLRVEKGRRYGGANTDFELRYKISPYDTLSATFTQSIENQQSARLDQARGLVVDPIGGDIIDPDTGEIIDPNESGFTQAGGSFQQDRAQVGLVSVRGRNNIKLNANFTSRDAKTGGTTEDQIGINLNFLRQMRRDLTGSIGAGYNDVIRSGTATGQQTTYRNSARLEYVLGSIFTSSLAYNHLLRTTEVGGDLSENVVTIGIDADF